MSRGIWVWLLATACICAVVAVAGCGDDDDSTAKEDQPEIQAASEPPEIFIERTMKLLTTATTAKDCDELYTLNGRSLSPLPCPAPPDLRKSMKRFKLVDAETYGTGAVVDYKSGTVKSNAAIVLYVARDRGWGIGRFGIYTDRSTGTADDASRAGYRAAVDRYLDAIETRDCGEFADVVFPEDPAKVCEKEFKETAPLAKVLRQNPSRKLTYQGGNQSYGFFTLETAKPQADNNTIGVLKGKTKQGKTAYVVLDIAATPTAAELRRVREAGKQQLQPNGPATPETSPQKKVDG